MTKDKAIAELIRIWHSPHLDLILKARLGEAIEALKGEDGDLINRADAIKCIRWGEGVTDVIERIKALPSAEPKTKCIAQIRIDQGDMENLVNKIVDKMSESKTGHWISDNLVGWKYSECGRHIVLNIEVGNYCPNCGARMENGYE